MGGRERSQANGLAMRSCWSGWTALQREASGQLRVQRPERTGSYGLATAFQQLRRSSEEADGPDGSSSRDVEEREAAKPLREIDLVGEGIRDAVLFLCTTSLTTDDAPWNGIPCRGLGFRPGRRRESRQRPSYGGNDAPPSAHSRGPATGAINSN